MAGSRVWPSYRTFNRFRVNPHVESQLVEEKLIEEEAIFNDGTKIEANANKFTFLWRKSIEREEPDSLSAEEMKQIVERLDDKVQEYDRKINVTTEHNANRFAQSVKNQRNTGNSLTISLRGTQKYQTDMTIFGDFAKRLLSEKETGKIYGRRKIDAEPVFGFLKANLCFTRFPERGKEKVENELGSAFMEVNMRK